MAGQAGHFGVLAQQWVIRLGMVELRLKRRFFPRRRAMAGFAGLAESALVRIGVAIGTVVEFDARIARLAVAARGVALLACRIHVHPGQRKARLRVVESGLVDLSLLPVHGGMALYAGRAETSLVRVLVACRAVRRESHPCVAEVFCAKQRAGRSSDVLCGVTRSAADTRVPAIQRVAGGRVIESLRRGIPVNHGEVLAVVVGMAFDACGPGWPGLRKGGMQPLVLLDLGCNLPVAVNATELRRARVD